MVEQRAGVHPDRVADDELQPGETHPGARQAGEMEGPFRVAHVHRDPDRDLGMAPTSTRRTSKSSLPS